VTTSGRSTRDVNTPTARPDATLPSYARSDLLEAVDALTPRLREAADEIERGRSLTEPLV
jgi:hypothetical protein